MRWSPRRTPLAASVMKESAQVPPSFASRCDTLLGAFYYLGRPCPCCWRRVWRGASAKMIRFASSRPSHFQFDLFYGVFLSLHIFLDFPYHFNAVNTVISLYILPFLLFPLSISFNCLHYSFFPSPPPVSFPYPLSPLPIYNTHAFLFLFPLFLPSPLTLSPHDPLPPTHTEPPGEVALRPAQRCLRGTQRAKA